MNRSDNRKRMAKAKYADGRTCRTGSKKGYHKGCFGKQDRN